jgi:glycerol-3-phosphate dehydrogenase (NAD(P)+)
MGLVKNVSNSGWFVSMIQQNIGAEIPIAETIYKILWERELPVEGFERVEEVLV